MKRRRLLLAAGVPLPALAVLALLAYGFTRKPRSWRPRSTRRTVAS